jgi:hypothetical protein
MSEFLFRFSCLPSTCLASHVFAPTKGMMEEPAVVLTLFPLLVMLLFFIWKMAAMDRADEKKAREIAKRGFILAQLPPPRPRAAEGNGPDPQERR